MNKKKRCFKILLKNKIIKEDIDKQQYINNNKIYLSLQVLEN